MQPRGMSSDAQMPSPCMPDLYTTRCLCPFNCLKIKIHQRPADEIVTSTMFILVDLYLRKFRVYVLANSSVIRTQETRFTQVQGPRRGNIPTSCLSDLVLMSRLQWGVVKARCTVSIWRVRLGGFYLSWGVLGSPSWSFIYAGTQV